MDQLIAHVKSRGIAMKDVTNEVRNMKDYRKYIKRGVGGTRRELPHCV